MKTYLFTGEENYLLDKELKKRKEGFLTKHGPDTVLSMSLGQYTATEIIQAVCSSGLFSDSKLIIIYGLPGETTSTGGTTDLEEQIIKHRTNLNDDYFYIFISPKPDKRKKAFKFFSEHCDVKTFSKMNMATLPRFINEEVQSHLDTEHKHIIIDKDTATDIINIVGSDGRNLSHECKKIAIAINMGQKLSSELLQSILTPLTETNNFGILEALIDRSPSIYTTIDNLSSQGEARQGIQGSLLRGLKTVVAFGVCNLHNQDPKGLGLPPFTIGKYLKHKESIVGHLSAYESLYNDLIAFDYQVKSGQASDTGYWLFMKEKIHTYFEI